MTGADDRRALARAFEDLNSGAFIALRPDRSRFTVDDGFSDVAEVAADRGLTDYDAIFWHHQSTQRAFDSAGSLVAPLAIHWVGDPARIHKALAALPKPYAVEFLGDHQAFLLIRSDLTEFVPDLPSPDDATAVASRVRWMDERSPSEFSGDEWAWLNEILRSGSDKSRARVVDWLIAFPDRLDDDAFEGLLERWVDVCKAAGDDAHPERFLRLVHARSNPHFRELLDLCLKQRRWTFRYAAAIILTEFGSDDDIPILHKLATTKAAKNSPIAGNPRAVQGWLMRRAMAEGTHVAALALEAHSDPAFDDAARNELLEQAAYAAEPTPAPGRLIRGYVQLLERFDVPAPIRGRIMEELDEHPGWDALSLLRRRRPPASYPITSSRIGSCRLSQAHMSLSPSATWSSLAP